MNREEKMESLRAQVEIMKENVKTTEKRLKDAQLHKIEEVKQTREEIKNKIQAEFDLRAAQCKTLELAFVALDAAEEDPLENGVAGEGTVKCLENQLTEILKELADLEKEGMALSEDVEKAEACYLTASLLLNLCPFYKRS